MSAAPATTRIVAYTDGGCRGNPGPGGWGFLLIDTHRGAALERWGAEAETTNNRMEITAALEALEALQGGRRRIEIRTDSVYLKNMATKWISGWKARGWTRRGDEPIKNLDLVQRLDVLLGRHDVSWAWVRGHDGEPGNEHADALTNRAMDQLAAGEPGAGEARFDVSPVALETASSPPRVGG